MIAHINKKDQLLRLRRMQWVTSLMDAQYSFLGVRYGIDSVIGLIPWFGDFVGGIVSAYIIWEAYKMGVPRPILRTMTANVILDVFVGGVPLLGDIFDVLFKSNQKNVALVEAYMKQQS